jgi:hypothetical protein
MDDSSMFQGMLDKAIKAHPNDFEGFDRSKNVQDQLQEMVGAAETASVSLEHFYKWMSGNRDISYQLSSWEQLWLSYVMCKKYNKVWNGEEWLSG